MVAYHYTIERNQRHTAEVTIHANTEDEADNKISTMISELNDSSKDNILTPEWELDSDEYQLE